MQELSLLGMRLIGLIVQTKVHVRIQDVDTVRAQCVLYQYVLVRTSTELSYTDLLTEIPMKDLYNEKYSYFSLLYQKQ